MTNDELNKYIKHYIEKDRTGRAVMLTGAWGLGKSYYIKNSLIPYLEKTENGGHQCIVVSLYGLSSLSEISKAVYLEARAGILKPASEARQIGILAAKTILKGITSHLGVDLTVDDKSLQALYKSIDLTGKLIVFEDVERTNINILELLGYVNSLVEQDNVKVLLVTNESILIRYKPVEMKEKDSTSESSRFVESKQEEAKKFTEETARYLETKEKSVGDTILFAGDLKSAAKEIICSFNNPVFQRLKVEQCAEDVAEIMYLMRCENLRSIIYACQKAVDIYEAIPNLENVSEDFLRTIFYGTVAFSIRINSGFQAKWEGLEYYSLELGIANYPLFRFCFDYITEQHLDTSRFSEAEETLKKLRFYDRNKTSADPDLQALSDYHIHTEEEVKCAVTNITRRLSNPADISFYDYGRIAAALIRVKHSLGIESEEAKALLVRNLKGKGNSINAHDIFWSMLWGNSKEEQEEYAQIRDDMIRSLNEKDDMIPGFDYFPEQTAYLYDYVIKNEGRYYESKGFTKYLDIPKFVEMLFQCSPAQMDRARCTFVSLYRPVNIKDFFADDLPAIEELKKNIAINQNNSNLDRVQKMQCQWFIDNLTEIETKLL